MILINDVYYWDDKAKSVTVAFDTWEEENIIESHEVELEDIEPYIPGEFYKRELPCILKVLESTPIEDIDLIIIDGYVILDDEGKWGLGAYLYDELKEEIPIIGVAKKNFIANTKNVREVIRGESKNPLYISSIGIDIDEAAELVKNMKGAYRMPDLLKLVDTKTKTIN